jgi:hypothetical protein
VGCEEAAGRDAEGIVRGCMFSFNNTDRESSSSRYACPKSQGCQQFTKRLKQIPMSLILPGQGVSLSLAHIVPTLHSNTAFHRACKRGEMYQQPTKHCISQKYLEQCDTRRGPETSSLLAAISMAISSPRRRLLQTDKTLNLQPYILGRAVSLFSNRLHTRWSFAGA